LLHLSWIDELLDNVKDLFVELYGSQLKKPNTSVVECRFDDYFDTLVRDLESTSGSLPTVSVEAIPPGLESSLDEPPPLPGLLRGKISEF
jgi:signal recognition particle receptor subunit alpha